MPTEPTPREREYLQIFAAYAAHKPPQPASPTLAEIGQELGGKQPGGVASVIARLVAKGLLEKTDAVKSRNYYLTAAGRRVARRNHKS